MLKHSIYADVHEHLLYILNHTVLTCMLFRYLYWGQGADKAGIFRSGLDGRKTLAVVSTVIEQPTGMTLGE